MMKKRLTFIAIVAALVAIGVVLVMGAPHTSGKDNGSYLGPPYTLSGN